MTDNKKKPADHFIVRVETALDRPSGAVLLMCTEVDRGIEDLSNALRIAGYDSYICRVSHAELLISDVEIENVVDVLYSNIREKYRYLPVFAVGVKGGAVALTASRTELCGAVIAGFPCFSEEGGKLIKKLRRPFLFKKPDRVYPKINDKFDRVFGEPFGKLPDDMSYAGVRILASFLSDAFGTLPLQSVPMLVLSARNDGYAKRYADALSDNDHSLVEYKSYDVSRDGLFSEKGVISDVIGFFNESLEGYISSLSQNFGGAG